MQTPSRVARAAAWIGGLSAAGLVLGPIAIQLGLLSPFIGFRLFMLGALLGLLALLLGVLGLWLTRPAAGRAGRGAATAGAVLGAAAVAVVLVAAGPSAGLPAINDITTDPDDPPVFRAAAELEANRNEDMDYPGEEFARAQRGAYPDLEPLHVDAPPDVAFRRARAAVLLLDWELTGEDERALWIEAREVTPVFRFADDVAIRVRPAPDGSGSIVDVRSRSRDGKGDLGANAARIRAFRDAFANP